MAILSAEDVNPRGTITVVPSDTVALSATRGLWVGGAGNITGRCADDSVDVVLTAIPAGTFIRGNWKLVKATGTTATNIVGYR